MIIHLDFAPMQVLNFFLIALNFSAMLLNLFVAHQSFKSDRWIAFYINCFFALLSAFMTLWISGFIEIVWVQS